MPDDDRRTSAAGRDEHRARDDGSTGDGGAGRSEGDTPPRHDVDEGRRAFITWVWRLPVVLAVAGGAFGVYEAVRVHFEKDAPAAHPVFAARPRQTVGPVEHFGEVWSSIPFRLGGEHPIPAIVVRLPGPIPGGIDVPLADGSTAHLAGFSRVCTYMGCTVYLNKDLKEIHLAFNYQTDHPDLTCPCHLCIFDLTLAGKAVSGPAVRPLPRVQLEEQGGNVVAVGLERT